MRSLGFEVLAGQAVEHVRAETQAKAVDERHRAPVLARLALAHVVLGHVVRDGALQVGHPGAGVRHVQRDHGVDRLRLEHHSDDQRGLMEE